LFEEPYALAVAVFPEADGLAGKVVELLVEKPLKV
jgi:hypothetical protein